MAKSKGSSTYKKAGGGAGKVAERYTHPDQTSPMRPDIGTQPQFRKKKPPKTYRYDSSLSPSLEWDGQNGSREIGEWLLGLIERGSTLPKGTFETPQEFKAADGSVVLSIRTLTEAVHHLKRLSKPFLTWTGKAERLSFDVPTLPLFVHERLSTKAIVDTLIGHKTDKQADMFTMFGDPQHSIVDQTLRAYEHQDTWVNRIVLGDSLVVMNSLLQYEGLGGQVQMIYIDPPYGVKFGSNFQPFVRKRDVSHNDDEDLTREPEMVKAYRDTWELGLHSYLTYMRDRLLLARDLLTPSGSMFIQIGDENVHHVRGLVEEVFGAENLVVTIVLKKKGGQKSSFIDPVNDYIVWAAKDRTLAQKVFHSVFVPTPIDSESLGTFRWVQLTDGREVSLVDLSEETSMDYRSFPDRLFVDFPGARLFTSENLTSGGVRANQSVIYHFRGRAFDPGIARGSCWKHTAKTDDGSPSGLDRLAEADRLFVGENQLRFKRFYDDFGFRSVTNVWDDLGGPADPIYVVQTNPEVVKRCMLMTTRPGDLVLDPTCGSGTTAYVAEAMGRRWITIDASRVPLALARQRLLTATFPYYKLQAEERGPSAGFVYKTKQNRKGEQVGGLVPHITSSTIANNEPPVEEVLADRPDQDKRFVRVTGPFAFEATIPTPVDWEGDGVEDSGAQQAEEYGSFVDRMIEVLRRSPVLHVGGGKTVQLANVRQPAKALSISAEAVVPATADGQSPTIAEAVDEAAERSGMRLPLSGKSVAFVFGPENGAISEQLVHAALKEAHLKSYTHLYVIGFAIQPHARDLIENAAAVGFLPATYVQATPDLMMGDLLKNMRSSQIFSVCGLPEIRVARVKSQKPTPNSQKDTKEEWQVELVGLDTFDPSTMQTDHRSGSDVPAWFLDTDYNGLCFHVSQAFFPRTAAWNDLRKSLKGDYDDSVWDHLAGTKSAPFEEGKHAQIAVKVIDDRGNELLVVRKLAAS